MGKRREPAAGGMAALRGMLAAMEFEVVPAGEGRYFLRKYDCAAGLAEDEHGELTMFAPPGRVVHGELARLVDRGFQKFLKTADEEIPARMEDLKALHDFQRDLHHAAGQPFLYNLALGSTTDRHLYDRIWFRDTGKQPRVWLDASSGLPQEEMAEAAQFPVSTGGGNH